MRGDVRAFLRGEDVTLSAMIVAAHPDDETLGAGALLQRPWRFTIVNVTDGAPRDRAHWNAPFADREAYAAARRAELARALALAGHAIERRCLDVVDLEAADDLARIVPALASVIAEVRPDVVLTHPYEGGHPDHDACAFAVAAARRRLARIGEHVPDALELAYYHAAGGEPVFGRFIADARRPEHAVTLAPDVRATKAAMLACFASQAQVLALFPIDVERYREAGDYDFSAPPHAGAPYYERMGWAEFAPWSARVRRAASELGLTTDARSDAGAIARDG